MSDIKIHAKPIYVSAHAETEQVNVSDWSSRDMYADINTDKSIVLR